MYASTHLDDHVGHGVVLSGDALVQDGQVQCRAVCPSPFYHHILRLHQKSATQPGRQAARRGGGLLMSCTDVRGLISA